MAASGPHWTETLPSLAACGLLPKLPPLAQLRQRVDNELKLPFTPVSHVAVPGAEHLFDSKRLYKAVHSCVQEVYDIPPHTKPVATLLISSMAMEDYVRSHSTKARLLASQLAIINRAVEEQKAKAEKATADNEHEELVKFLSTASKGEIVEKLLGVLGEPREQRDQLMGIVKKYSLEDLAAILSATKRAFAQGDTDRADGSGSRTMGGVFFREVKRYKSTVNWAAIQATRPSLPPLWSHQRDLVAAVLLSWGLQLPREVLEVPGGGGGGSGGDGEVEMVEGALRSRWQKLARGWSRNWLVSSPTNSGKTRMFVEVARGVIESKPSGVCAIIVVLVPSVILTTQHVTDFEKAQLPRTQSSPYSSDNPLTLKAWMGLRTAAFAGIISSVVVATADSFLNLLQIGAASISDVDLLILDEAHHCKGDHPYARVMSIYGKTPMEARRPRVLAVTASPASETDMATLNQCMDDLLRRLDARLYLVDPEHPDVASVLSEPSLIEDSVKMRQIDHEIMTTLQVFALNAGMEIEKALATTVRAVGKVAIKEKEDLSQALLDAIDGCIADCASTSNKPLVTRLDQLGQWLAMARKFASTYKCPNLDLAARLLDIVRKSIELLEDAGFEGALPFLARKSVLLCTDELKVHGGVGGGTFRIQAFPQCSKPTRLRNEMSMAAIQAGSADDDAGVTKDPVAATATLACSPASVGPVATDSDGANGCSMPQVLSSLAAMAAIIAPARDLAIQAEGSGSAAALPGNSCDDIPLRVSNLLKDLLTSEESRLWLGDTNLVEHCFGSGEFKEERTFPKFWALLRYLQRYRDKPNFHGIVFVRTRQVALRLCDGNGPIYLPVYLSINLSICVRA
ncbi:hypothetical protein Vretimale_5983 [Volvox reticuliferus]|uniref:Helicase ATP-binding domain-containing protein n=1 Tax=Volvox reticuliferus TaxID=1737510 RepID=A0A8J4G6L9_9CHLO|nr:hypothetical protein Vretimale_5983 [Volvox reticuliferus]